MLITMNFGRVEIVTCHKWEGDKLIMGGFARHYDGTGKLVSVTPPSWNGSIDFSGFSDAQKYAIAGRYLTASGSIADNSQAP